MIYTRHKQGFTLIELLVVIAIIGTLASVVLAALNSARAKARDSLQASQIREVNTAIENYFTDHGSYPSTGGMNNVFMDPSCGNPTGPGDQRTANWVPSLVAGKYISSLPQDPNGGINALGGSTNTGACYMYSSDGTHYVLSAWATVTGGVSSSNGLHSCAGFREPNYNISNATYYCDEKPGILPYYAYSYTMTNETCACT